MSVSSAGSASSNNNNKSFGAAIFFVLYQLDHQNNEEKKFDLRIGWDLNSQLHGQQTAFITTTPKRKDKSWGLIKNRYWLPGQIVNHGKRPETWPKF